MELVKFKLIKDYIFKYIKDNYSEIGDFEFDKNLMEFSSQVFTYLLKNNSNISLDTVLEGYFDKNISEYVENEIIKRNANLCNERAVLTSLIHSLLDKECVSNGITCNNNQQFAEEIMDRLLEKYTLFYLMSVKKENKIKKLVNGRIEWLKLVNEANNSEISLSELEIIAIREYVNKIYLNIDYKFTESELDKLTFDLLFEYSVIDILSGEANEMIDRFLLENMFSSGMNNSVKEKDASSEKCPVRFKNKKLKKGLRIFILISILLSGGVIIGKNHKKDKERSEAINKFDQYPYYSVISSKFGLGRDHHSLVSNAVSLYIKINEMGYSELSDYGVYKIYENVIDPNKMNTLEELFEDIKKEASSRGIEYFNKYTSFLDYQFHYAYSSDLSDDEIQECIKVINKYKKYNNYTVNVLASPYLTDRDLKIIEKINQRYITKNMENKTKLGDALLIMIEDDQKRGVGK